jgi:hypothetical protein
MNHIKSIHDDTESFCGEKIGNDFYFKNVEAAILNGMHGTEKFACRDCTYKITQALMNGAYDENRPTLMSNCT